MFIFFIWIFVAILTGYMADKRGRSGLLGFFIGLFTGIFGMLFYAIIGETEEKKLETLKRYKEMLRD